MLYLWIKVLHVVSSTVLFGTGLGIAFFKVTADASGNVKAMRVVGERVVWADWLFTTPAIVVQALTGVALAKIAGFPLLSGWVLAAIMLYCAAGACWLPVVWLQIRMRDLARQAEQTETAIGERYWSYARLWFWLGVPAFVAVLAVFVLMVLKPAL
jgi:uncharacterized membrane protein